MDRYTDITLEVIELSVGWSTKWGSEFSCHEQWKHKIKDIFLKMATGCIMLTSELDTKLYLLKLRVQDGGPLQHQKAEFSFPAIVLRTTVV